MSGRPDAERALALATSLGAQLATLGPGVRALSIDDVSTWQVIRIGAASSDALRRIAEDLQLDQGRTGRWSRMLSAPSGAIVLSASVHRER